MAMRGFAWDASRNAQGPGRYGRAPCKVCGKDFTRKRWNHDVCSDICRRRKRRDGYKDNLIAEELRDGS